MTSYPSDEELDALIRELSPSDTTMLTKGHACFKCGDDEVTEWFVHESTSKYDRASGTWNQLLCGLCFVLTSKQAAKNE